MTTLQNENSLSRSPQNSIQSNFSSFIRKYTQRPGPISPMAAFSTSTRPLSAKASNLSTSSIPSRHSLNGFPSTAINRQSKEKSHDRSLVSEQENLAQENKRPSTTAKNHKYKDLTISQGLESSDSCGLIDRYTFYSSNFSLFDPKSCPRRSTLSSPLATHTTVNQYSSHKTLAEANPKIIKEEPFEGDIQSESSSIGLKRHLSSTSSSKLAKPKCASSKQLECIIQGALPLKASRPTTVKNASNALTESIDGFLSVKNSTSQMWRKESPQSKGLSKKTITQALNSSVSKSTKVYRPLREEKAKEELAVMKFNSTPSKTETRSQSNLKKNPMLEPGSTDYGKYNKIFKGIDNKGSNRFAPEHYKRLGKSPTKEDIFNAQDANANTTEAPPSQRDLYKLQRKIKGSYLSQGDISLTHLGSLDNINNVYGSMELIANEDNEFTYDPESTQKSGSIGSLAHIDNIYSHSSLEKGTQSHKSLHSVARGASAKSQSKINVKSQPKVEKETKVLDPEVVKKQQEVFEEFFNSAISYMCEIIDGTESRPTSSQEESQEQHLNILLDHIIKEIYVMKKGMQEDSERSAIAKRLLMLLNMSLRSMVCLIRRKETSIRRLYNKSCSGGLFDKKGLIRKQENVIKFEELCGLENEQEEREENERGVREKLCQEIQKSKEELEGLEKFLKDAKKNKSLQYVQVVNIKIGNLLKGKKKSNVRK